MGTQLEAQQCSECGRISMMAFEFCPQCRCHNSYRTKKVEGLGSVYSYTIVHVSDSRLQLKSPYLLAVIESVEGVRLLGRLDHPATEPVKIGDRVEFVEWKDGAPLFQKKA